jgi:hypothetical protein
MTSNEIVGYVALMVAGLSALGAAYYHGKSKALKDLRATMLKSYETDQDEELLLERVDRLLSVLIHTMPPNIAVEEAWTGACMILDKLNARRSVMVPKQ